MAPRRAWRVSGGKTLLFLRVTPNAAKEEIGGLWRGADGEERLAVRVSAPPDKGRANQAVVKALSKALLLPKSAIAIVAGDRDRLKTVAIDSDSADMLERIAMLAGEKGSSA